jgi:2'-5' RNA ligase
MEQMATHYVNDVSQWKTWQQKYRFGVLLIYPPDPPFSQANALREKYDKISAVGCDAHISLTIPFPRPMSKSYWNELEAIASKMKSFNIHYGPLKHYLPHPGICFAIQPQEELNQLRIALESASVFEGAHQRKYPFSAHLTIAEFITVERTKELMIELKDAAPEGDFICNNVSYAVPDENLRFTERARLTLSEGEVL